MGLPPKQGLYDPINEHDACGVGFVANIKGAKSHEIIGLGLQLLINLDHRGAVGADPLVGDGAGILIQIPDPLFREWAKETGVTLPAPGQYAVAMCFLPREAKAREIVVKQFEHFIKVEGQKLLGWRDVPTDPAGLGKTGLAGASPTVANPVAPTVTELRRLAIWNNYRAILDIAANGGYGTLYGPNIDVNGNPTLGEGKIAGTEYLAYADDGTGKLNVTMMVQIPTSFSAASRL